MIYSSLNQQGIKLHANDKEIWCWLGSNKQETPTGVDPVRNKWLINSDKRRVF